jgi:hypothetical protein
MSVEISVLTGSHFKGLLPVAVRFDGAIQTEDDGPENG